jgi:hypothetical protein
MATISPVDGPLDGLAIGRVEAADSDLAQIRLRTRERPDATSGVSEVEAKA